MFGIGWDVLQPKGNIIAPIVFIPAKKKHLLISCRCDLQYKVYIENIFINEDNCISSKQMTADLSHSVPLDPFSHPSRKFNRYQTNSPACIPSGVGRPRSSWNNTESHPQATCVLVRYYSESRHWELRLYLITEPREAVTVISLRPINRGYLRVMSLAVNPPKIRN